MEGGLISPTTEGVPQGGPLSPALSNVYPDKLDRELEGRELRFVRYADDCNTALYNSDMSDEELYAGLGAVIRHEIS